jgi:hypothetical protein
MVCLSLHSCDRARERFGFSRRELQRKANLAYEHGTKPSFLRDFNRKEKGRYSLRLFEGIVFVFSGVAQVLVTLYPFEPQRGYK